MRIAVRALPLSAFMAALLSGCAANRPLTAPASANWRVAATEADGNRLRDWRQTFVDALADAQKAGFGPQIEAEGPLLEPDATLGGPLPPGRYVCRTIKIGARSESNRHFITYPATGCEVETVGAVEYFSAPGGVQRPTGFIYPGDRLHGVFLGALSLGDEKASMRYGVDPDRDMAGWVDRIGDARWRIVLPRPNLESMTDVIELVPAAG